jgi:hypothetical protein
MDILDFRARVLVIQEASGDPDWGGDPVRHG